MTQFLRKTLIAAAVAGAMTVGASAFAQTKPAVAPAAPAANSAAIDAKFKGEKDKYGYMIGTMVARNLSEIKDEVDVNSVIAALKAGLEGGKPLLTDAELGQVNQDFMQKMRAKQTAKLSDEAKKNQAAGDAFLAGNKAKAGVKETASGLQYEVIKEGAGAKPKATDTVKVEYLGTKVDGTKFDASADHGGPATFPLNQVIPGWTEGVQLMTVGSHYKFFVPAKLAYGEHGPPQIGPNATLIFDVTLLGVEPPSATPDTTKSIQPVKKQAQ